MSTLKTVNLQHPSAPSPNLVLNADGSVTGGQGKVLQVVQATDTTDRTTTSSSPVDANISVTITPQKSTSAIIIVYSFRLRATDRGFVGITDASNNDISGAETSAFFETGVVDFRVVTQMVGYDTPATTSATTYKARFGNTDSQLTELENAAVTGRMFAIEVAA